MIPRLDSELQQLQAKQGRVQELKPKIEEVSYDVNVLLCEIYCLPLHSVLDHDLQLSSIRTHELSKRQVALEEKEKEVSDAQAAIENERDKQACVKHELEHIRSLQPKVGKERGRKEERGGGGGGGGGMGKKWYPMKNKVWLVAIVVRLELVQEQGKKRGEGGEEPDHTGVYPYSNMMLMMWSCIHRG